MRRDCGDRGRMRVYSFSLVNHLGERFRTRTASCDDDAAAIAHARRFEREGSGYGVFHLRIFPSVGKRIRREVDDAHVPHGSAPVYDGHGLGSRARIGAENAPNGAGHGAAAGLSHTAHGHAEVLSLNDDTDSERVCGFDEKVGYL